MFSKKLNLQLYESSCAFLGLLPSKYNCVCPHLPLIKLLVISMWFFGSSVKKKKNHTISFVPASKSCIKRLETNMGCISEVSVQSLNPPDKDRSPQQLLAETTRKRKKKEQRCIPTLTTLCFVFFLKPAKICFKAVGAQRLGRLKQRRARNS